MEGAILLARRMRPSAASRELDAAPRVGWDEPRPLAVVAGMARRSPVWALLAPLSSAAASAAVVPAAARRVSTRRRAADEPHRRGPGRLRARPPAARSQTADRRFPTFSPRTCAPPSRVRASASQTPEATPRCCGRDPPLAALPRGLRDGDGRPGGVARRADSGRELWKAERSAGSSRPPAPEPATRPRSRPRRRSPRPCSRAGRRRRPLAYAPKRRGPGALHRAPG